MCPRTEYIFWISLPSPFSPPNSPLYSSLSSLACIDLFLFAHHKSSIIHKRIISIMYNIPFNTILLTLLLLISTIYKKSIPFFFL